MIKVLVADDHAIVRQGLKQIVSDTNDIVVVGEASDGQELLRKLEESDCNIVLLDITMPGRSGLDILKELKNIRPNLPVLVLSMHPEEQYATRVIRAGAHGYLTKDSVPDELTTAIRKVASGGNYISSTFAEKLVFTLREGIQKSLYELLSDREYEVMCMIALGKTVKQIADELSLSVKTISTYRSRILEKTDMKNNSEITRYAIEHHLCW